jgi:hypothetical protein
LLLEPALLVLLVSVVLLVEGAGACSPTEAFVLGALGLVLVWSLVVCAVELDGVLAMLFEGDELAVL